MLNRSFVYLKQTQMMLQDVLIYRADFISRFISWGARFMITAFLWTAVMRSAGGHIEEYSQQSILTYFLLIQIVAGFIFGAVGFRVSNEISSGDLSSHLVKPVHPLLLAAAADLGRNLFFFISNFVIYLIIAAIFPNYFEVHWNLSVIPWAMLSLLMAYLSNTCFLVLIGMLAFWTGTAERLLFVFFSIVHLLSGVIIPIDLFSENFEHALYFTPFPYLFYVPVKLFQSTEWIPQTFQWLGVSALYMIALLLLTELMFRKGLKSYEAAGQ